MRRLTPREWKFEFCVERGCVTWYAVTRAISTAAVAFFSTSVTSNPLFRKRKKKDQVRLKLKILAGGVGPVLIGRTIRAGHFLA